SEAYEDRLMSATITTWACFQGEDKLDDEDFFRIAGDTQAAEDIHNGRDRAVAVNRAGWVVLGVGVAVGILGGVLAATVKTTDNTDPMHPVTSASPVGRYVLTGGILAALIGGSLAFYGNAAAKREHPLDDPRRAKRDERKYNKEKGVTPV